MDTVLLRAALPSIPLLNQLPGVRKTGGDPSSLRQLRSVTLARGHVAAYAHVCGFPVKDVVPLTFPHVLAFPLHMAVMTSPDFPFPAIGTVHIANTITQHRPIGVDETVQVEVRTSAVRPHLKGQAIDFSATVRAEGETVWESTSTYLRRGPEGVVSTSSTDASRGPADAGRGAADAGRGPADAGRGTADADHGSADAGRGSVDPAELVVVPGRVTWRLAGDVGRRYAAVSGDRNPIHLYRATAKALGYPRQIAHGMWSLARCLAALENRLPDAVRVDAAFTKPILLPGTVAFGQDSVSDPAGPGIAFALTSPRSGAPHLLGRTRAAP